MINASGHQSSPCRRPCRRSRCRRRHGKLPRKQRLPVALRCCYVGCRQFMKILFVSLFMTNLYLTNQLFTSHIQFIGKHTRMYVHYFKTSSSCTAFGLICCNDNLRFYVSRNTISALFLVLPSLEVIFIIITLLDMAFPKYRQVVRPFVLHPEVFIFHLFLG